MKPSVFSYPGVVEVAIIGAGPYGLSLAAHLSAHGVPFRIFGDPMSAWSKQMPKGMHLKSEGFASSLSAPGSAFTLRHFCSEQHLPYADTGLPVPLETFISYGLEFQKRFVPQLEKKKLISLRQAAPGFELQLENGEMLVARRVVAAIGISHFAHIPACLAGLPGEFVTHSSAHNDPGELGGRRVAVIGAGASALDLAALLHEAGACVEVIARRPVIHFHDPPRQRTLRERILQPMTGLGSGRQLFFYVHAPRVFRLLPQRIRLDRVHKTLGPAPAWFIRDRVVGKVPLHLGFEITGAGIQQHQVVLSLEDRQGNRKTIEADHVIAATGYRVDLRRLDFLCAEMRNRIETVESAPTLSSTFESSIPGLYFVGVTAANTFGPLMRFAYGCEFAARHLARHLNRLVVDRVQAGKETGTVQILERT